MNSMEQTSNQDDDQPVRRADERPEEDCAKDDGLKGDRPKKVAWTKPIIIPVELDLLQEPATNEEGTDAADETGE